MRKYRRIYIHKAVTPPVWAVKGALEEQTYDVGSIAEIDEDLAERYFHAAIASDADDVESMRRIQNQIDREDKFVRKLSRNSETADNDDHD